MYVFEWKFFANNVLRRFVSNSWRKTNAKYIDGCSNGKALDCFSTHPTSKSCAHLQFSCQQMCQRLKPFLKTL